MALFGFIFFGLCAFVLARKAATNDRGARISRVFELSPAEADILYSSLAAMALVFSSGGLLLLWQRLFAQQRLVIAEEGILLPKYQLCRQEMLIRYASIESIYIRSVGSNRSIQIHHSGGRRQIIGRKLSSKANLDELLGLIIERVKLATQSE